MMSAETPDYVPGHDLLRDKSVIVTAAAGTGIGFAVAKRCLEEGAHVLISDIHERRLGEAVDALRDVTATRRRRRCATSPSENDVDAALRRPRSSELGAVDVLMNNAGLGGTATVTEMTDEQWTSVIDVTLNGTFRATRAALRHMIPRGSGVIVNNASVHGMASAGRAGALRRGQSRRHGLHALRGDRGGRRRGARQRRGARASRCTRSSPRSRPTSCSSS